MVANVVNLLTFIKHRQRRKMVKITWKGWRDHPTEKLEEAYEILTGRNFKPFYKVFSTPKTKNNQSKGNIEYQTEQLENESER